MKDENFEELAKNNLKSREHNEVEVEEVKPTSLGKASIYKDDSDEPALLPGYHEIYSEEFPSGGLFYPKDVRFFIRAASVKEIRHFSTIDETDPFSVDEALTDIIKGCLMMRSPGKRVSFKDLKEEDRIHIILAIRELTFVDGENMLAIPKRCEECQTDNQIPIKNSSFTFNGIDDKISKYYNTETRIFEIETKSLGVIKMEPPSIGVMMEVTKYIRTKAKDGKKLDQSFLKVLPYLISDWKGLNVKKIQSLELAYMQWNTKKFQTMNALSAMVKVGVKEILNSECEGCGSEVSATIQFPGGIKSLFVVSDISDELL